MIWEYIIAGLLVVAGIFGFVGSFGLLKLNDPMSRLHAPTKATTVGVGGVLIASMAYAWGVGGTLSVHELLISLFLFLTAPITANFIAKAHIHRNADPDSLPETGSDQTWACLKPQDPPADPAPESRPS